MKIVADTNVLLSGLLFPGGPPDKIVRAILSGTILNATSPDLLTELRRVLRKKFNLSGERLDALIRLIAESSKVVYPVERLCVIRADDADNRVLECAVTAQAEAIVTGDERHLIRLRSFQIRIVRTAQFVQEMGFL